MHDAANPDRLAALVREQISILGEDPDREGLVRTPDRVQKSLRFLTSGYRTNIETLINDAVFQSTNDEMVLVRDIEMYSLCEHHLLPFFGKAHVAYVPNGRIIGLSKIPRIVDMFARRLQVQERLTSQIADALNAALRPKGVGVVVEAHHLCMMMRGIEKQNSSAITSAMVGEFQSDQKTRIEFLELLRNRGR